MLDTVFGGGLCGGQDFELDSSVAKSYVWVIVAHLSSSLHQEGK